MVVPDTPPQTTAGEVPEPAPGPPGQAPLRERGHTGAGDKTYHRQRPLVVLSGCETGRGRPHGGGLLGMGRGLLAAGASALLLTLWRVEDQHSARLMTDFYESLKLAAASAAHPYATLALRQAQTAAIVRGLSPFYWAGYLFLAG